MSWAVGGGGGGWGDRGIGGPTPATGLFRSFFNETVNINTLYFYMVKTTELQNRFENGGGGGGGVEVEVLKGEVQHLQG